MNRLREGFLCTRNPFNARQVRRVSLLPQDVEAIVFWTRNPEPILPCLAQLEQLGHTCCFLFTITGYPRLLEKRVPSPQAAIETFIKLSARIGPDKVVWRYDPVLISSLVSVAEQKRLFGKIAAALAGQTNRVIISFADLYPKVRSNLDRFAAANQVVISDLTKDPEALLELSLHFANTANAHGMEIQSCAEKLDLDGAGIRHGKCLDADWLERFLRISLPHTKDKGQRDECGCLKSTDIGMYNTCLHGCEYCYATYSEASVKRNILKHDPHSPFLIGPADQQSSSPPGLANNFQPELFAHANS